MLYTSVVADDESSHTVLMAGTVAVATLVVLACRLPGDPEPGGDLWPSDALIDGIVDQVASSASASSRTCRACSICSSTSGTDGLVTGRAMPAGSPDACCRDRDSMCLTLGPDRRLDLPMESSMRPTYDNPGRYSPEGRPPVGWLIPLVM